MDTRTYQIALRNVSGSSQGGGGNQGSGNIPSDIEDRLNRLENSVKSIRMSYKEDFSSTDNIDLINTSADIRNKACYAREYNKSYSIDINNKNDFEILDRECSNIDISNGKITSTERLGVYNSKRIDVSNLDSVTINISENHKNFIGESDTVTLDEGSEFDGEFAVFYDDFGGKWTIGTKYGGSQVTSVKFTAKREFNGSESVVNTDIPLVKPYGGRYTSSQPLPNPHHYVSSRMSVKKHTGCKILFVSFFVGAYVSYNNQNIGNASYWQLYYSNPTRINILIDYSSDNIVILRNYKSNTGLQSHGGKNNVNGAVIYYGKVHAGYNSTSEIHGDIFAYYDAGYKAFGRSTGLAHLPAYGFIDGSINANITLKHTKDGVETQKSLVPRQSGRHPYMLLKSLNFNNLAHIAVISSSEIAIDLITTRRDVDDELQYEIKQYTISSNTNTNGSDISEKLSSIGISDTAWFPDTNKYDGLNKIMVDGDTLYVFSAINRDNRDAPRLVIAKYQLSIIDNELSIAFDENSDISSFYLDEKLFFNVHDRCWGDQYKVNYTSTYDKSNAANSTLPEDCQALTNNIVIKDDNILMFYIMKDESNSGKEVVVYKSVSTDLVSCTDDYIVHQSNIDSYYVYSDIHASLDANGDVHLSLNYSSNSDTKYNNLKEESVIVGEKSSTTCWLYRVSSNPNKWTPFGHGDTISTKDDEYINLRCNFNSDKSNSYTEVNGISLDVVNAEDVVVKNTLVTNRINNVCRVGSVMIISQLDEGTGSIDWDITFDGGKSWNSINLNEDFKYELNHTPNVKVRATLTCDRSVEDYVLPSIELFEVIFTSINQKSHTDSNLMSIMKTNMKLDVIMKNEPNIINNVYISSFGTLSGINQSESVFEYDDVYCTVGGSFITIRDIKIPPEVTGIIVSSIESDITSNDIITYSYSTDGGYTYHDIQSVDSITHISNESGYIKVKATFKGSAKLKAISVAWI